MSTISERLAYILTFDTTQGVKSLEKLGKTADDELKKADARLDKLGSNMVKVGAGAMAFAGIAGAGLFKIASGAADAEANMAALEQVVGKTVAQQIGKWAENSARGVGLASKDAVAAATSFAQLGKIIGLGGQDLSKFSTNLVGLSADFAAFKNIAPEQALQDIQAAFAGSTEVMRKYGIFLDDATLKTAYFRETGEKVTGTLTAQQKIVAINAEMYRQGADMIGQWNRESGELQGQLATMKANLTNLADNIGSGVLPHVVSLVSIVGKAAAAFSTLDRATAGTVGSVATVAVGFVGLAGAVLFATGKIILMRKEIAELATKAPRAMATITAAAAPLAVALTGLALHANAVAKRNREVADSYDAIARATDDMVLDEFYKSLMTSVLDGAEALDKFARANLGAAQRVLDRMKVEGQSKELTDQLSAAIDREVEARKQAVATAELETAALDENTESTEDNTDATKAAEEAQKKAKDAYDQSTATLDRKRKAIEADINATLSAINSSLGYRNAQASATEAVRKLTDQEWLAKASASEVAAATRDAEGAILSQAAAAVKLRDDQATANGVTLNAADKARIYRDELNRLRGTLSGDLAIAIGMHIDALNRVPRSVHTNMSVSGGTVGGVGVAGRRARGGPVQSGKLYEVDEGGRSEVFQDGSGRTYLMPGSDGHVYPAASGGAAGAGVTNIYNSFDMRGVVGLDPVAFPRVVVEAINRNAAGGGARINKGAIGP